MKKHRVVITGIGALTPCGVGWEQLWQSVLTAKSAIGPITSFDPEDLPVSFDAEVRDFKIDNFVTSKSGLRLDRSAQLALAAGQLAICDAAPNPARLDRFRCGVFDGSSLGPLAALLKEHRGYLGGERCRGGPGSLISGMTGNSSATLAEHFDMHAVAETLSLGSVSSTTAIGRAFEAVQRGELDFALGGGCEAPLCREIMLPFIKAGVLSRRAGEPAAACRPFAADREGFVMGEGAAYLALESLDHALARESRIYCELIGFAQTVDAFHPTTPDPSGSFVALAIANCLANAARKPSEVGYVNLHGTATPQNDLAEAAAFKLAFGDSQPWCGSTKPITGHLLGACGAVELAITALALKFDLLPPSLNSEPRDPQCSLRIVTEDSVSQPLSLALTINNSFGGRNSAVALQKYITN